MNNVISGNEAQFNYGGGIYCEYYSSPDIVNNLIVRNISAYGAGVCCESYASPKLVNNTISKNAASISTGAFYCTASCSPTIRNSVLWDNTFGEISGSPAVTYSNIMGGYSGAGNINQNPLFMRGPLGAYYLKQINAGQPVNSPCIDAGDHIVGRDFASGYTAFGTTRIDRVEDGDIIDMGYHYPCRGVGMDSGHQVEEALLFQPHKRIRD
jgi:hypothetical protein